MNKDENIEELKTETSTDQNVEENSTEETVTDNSVEDKKNEAMLELDKQIVALEEENKKLLDQVKRAQAELVNYRVRKDKEVQDTLKFANQSLITELLSTVDNFERAITLDDNNLDDDLSKFLVGFKMIYSSLVATLKKYGVEEISRQGEIFDPALEQALLTDCVEELDNDVVIEVLQKGYKLKDRVIRAASVKINQK